VKFTEEVWLTHTHTHPYMYANTKTYIWKLLRNTLNLAHLKYQYDIAEQS
jgi:hypothetical protein